MALLYHAIPTFNTATTEWGCNLAQLGTPLGCQIVRHIDPSGTDIATKRNQMAVKALETGCEHTLFQSDDVLLPANFLHHMLTRIRLGAKMVTGMYWTKTHPPEPYVWNGILKGSFMNWHVGDYIPVDWAGCDALLIHNDVFRNVPQPWFSLDYEYHEEAGGLLVAKTEDVYFYNKCKQYGYQLMLDTSMQCGHVDRNTGTVFGMPDNWAQAFPGSEIPVMNEDYLLADIGCGTRLSHRSQSVKVIRIDLDQKVNPDVVADARWLPSEADNKYDEVNAHHILEHLTYKDGFAAIKEWIRILKPDGLLEIRVPNAQFAYEKLAAGDKDVYYTWMIHGLQINEYQIHYNSFSPESLRHQFTIFENLHDIQITLEANPRPGAEIMLRARKIKPTTIDIIDPKVWDEKPPPELTPEQEAFQKSIVS